MGQSIEHECPECDAETFTRVASTQLHLGRKVKWSCTDCEYGFVRINGAVDTSPA